MAKLEAEKQALAELKKGPEVLNPDEQSLARLKAMRGEAATATITQAAAEVPAQTAQVY